MRQPNGTYIYNRRHGRYKAILIEED